MKPLIFCLFFYCATGFAQDEKATVFNATLKKGEMFFFGDNSLEFRKVISDSRCPKEVTCVWAGEARVLIHIFQKGKFKSERIITIGGGMIPLNLPEGNLLYSLSGMVLSPYPSVKNEDFGKEYELNLCITEEK